MWCGVSMETARLAILGHLISGVRQLAQTARAAGFRHTALAQLQEALPLHAAIWAEATIGTSFILHQPEMYNLPLAAIADAQSAAGMDPRLSQVLAAPQTAISYSIEPHDPAILQELCARHGIGHIMSCAQFDTTLGLASGLVLTRQPHSPAFSIEDRALFEAAFPHLIQSWADCQVTDLVARSSRTIATPGFAVISKTGALTAAQPKVISLLQQEWPDWSGGTPPKQLMDHLTRQPPELYRGKKIVARLVAHTDADLLAVRARLPVDSLTKREKQIAAHTCEGKTYREIATLLGLADATIRNHLAAIYRRLAISKRSDLVHKMNDARLD
jgi:DNA-binding CsgD family transcriptional regulator